MPRPELAGHRTKCFSGLNQDRKFSHRTGTMNFQNFEPAQTDRFLLHFTYVCLHMYVFWYYSNKNGVFYRINPLKLYKVTQPFVPGNFLIWPHIRPKIHRRLLCQISDQIINLKCTNFPKSTSGLLSSHLDLVRPSWVSWFKLEDAI